MHVLQCRPGSLCPHPITITTSTIIIIFTFTPIPRMLESCYPKFPTENTFLHHIQSRAVQEDGMHTLLQFALEKPRLQVRTYYHHTCPYYYLVSHHLSLKLIRWGVSCCLTSSSSTSGCTLT